MKNKLRSDMLIYSKIEIEGLIGQIYDNISHEEVVPFIIKLEKIYEDWGVTEKLYKYFKKQKDIYIEEFPEENEDW